MIKLLFLFSKFIDFKERKLSKNILKLSRTFEYKTKKNALKLIQKNHLGLCLEVEFLFKNYSVLSKKKRRSLFENITIIENDFYSFLSKSPAYNSEVSNLDYLRIIQSYLELDRKFKYKESSSIYGILNVDSNLIFEADCNQLVNLYIHLYSLKFDVSDLKLKLLKDHVCLHFDGIDFETTNGTETKYEDYLYITQIQEIIAVNILDINDYDLISENISAKEFLAASKICTKLSSNNEITKHNLKVAYQKMGQHFEKFNQFKDAYKFWKILNDKQNLDAFFVRYVKHLSDKNNFEKSLKWAKKSKNTELIKYSASKYYNSLYVKYQRSPDNKKKRHLKKMIKLAYLIDDKKLIKSLKSFL